MIEQTHQKMTLEEYLLLPSTNTPTQLIDGALLVSPSPTPLHQEIVFEIAKQIDARTTNGKVYVAPIDVHLTADTVVQPDVLWLAPDSNCTRQESYLQGTLELIVEVLSPGTTHLDIGRKFHLYEEQGVQEYWIVDPMEQFITIWQRVENNFHQYKTFLHNEILESPLLKQEFDLKEVF